MVSIEMRALQGLFRDSCSKSSTMMFSWCPIPSGLIWSGMEAGPQGNSPLCWTYSSLAQARSEAEKKTGPFTLPFGAPGNGIQPL